MVCIESFKLSSLMWYKNFKSWEFDSPDLPGSGKKMNVVFMSLLEAARLKADIPFIINSGYRSVSHNSFIGGEADSAHLIGKAADIYCGDSVSRIKIIISLVETGFTRIGVGENFIHVDSDSSKPDALWLYPHHCKDVAIELRPFSIEEDFTRGSLDWSHQMYQIERLHQMGFKGKGIKVAVLDTGLDLNHDSFKTAVQEGRLKAIDGRNGINKPEDKNGHGTWCVSRFISNGTRAQGFAPECEVLSIKVLNDNGSGSITSITRGANLAIEAGVDIISSSIGWSGRYDPFTRIVKRATDAGIHWFSASGNDGKNEHIDFPALEPRVLSIGSHDNQKKKSGFSDYGVDLDLYGPGSRVKAAFLHNKEAIISGTSMATPSVAAFAAVLYDHLDGDLSRENLKKIAKCQKH